MNLNAYDNVKEELDKHKTWYSPKFRRLYSREIKFRMFYKFLKRWNGTIKRNDYFLAISMSNTDGRFYRTERTVDFFIVYSFICSNFIKVSFFLSKF